MNAKVLIADDGASVDGLTDLLLESLGSAAACARMSARAMWEGTLYAFTRGDVLLPTGGQRSEAPSPRSDS